MKNILPRFAWVLILVAGLSCSRSREGNTSSPSSPSHPFQINFKALSKVIVERAQLQPGERVLLVAKTGDFDSTVYHLAEGITSAQAVYLGTIDVDGKANDSWQTEFTKMVEGKSRAEMATRFEDVDLAIMLPGADTTHAPYAAMQDVLRQQKGRTIHFHWAGAYQMNGTPMERTQQMDQTYQVAVLNTDYEIIAREHLRLEEAMRSGAVRITTPLGTDIRFLVGKRPVTRQDGDASRSRCEKAENLIDREIELPAGAVRVAPVEESVEGKIAFPPGTWNGTMVKGLVMTFRRGKVVSVQADEGLEVVQSELDSAGAAAAFREFAIGFNPWLAVPEVGPQWIPYYGYGAGVIRLSLGDNSELGGRVKGNYVRWTFFTDATVAVGKEIWLRNGKLVKF